MANRASRYLAEGRVLEPTGRLMEGSNGSGGGDRAVHWMPKEGEAWECPDCRAFFSKADGVWKEFGVE